MGGIVGDLLYKWTGGSLWAKKANIVFVGVISGVFLIAIGLTNPNEEAMMFGLIAGMAVFLEAGNGANFALVPHVHPYANGILSGVVGATGNAGGKYELFVVLYSSHHQCQCYRPYCLFILHLLIICTGIAYALNFRFNHTNYAKSFWITGVVVIASNLAVCWIRPIPKGQVGGS